MAILDKNLEIEKNRLEREQNQEEKKAHDQALHKAHENIVHQHQQQTHQQIVGTVIDHTNQHVHANANIQQTQQTLLI